MDDRNAIILLDRLTEIFIEMDPARSHIYERNRLRLLKPLKRIDREYEYGYRGLKSGIGVQYYDTLYYFEQAYALNVMDQVTDTPWSKVAAHSLLRVRNHLLSRQANCLFLDQSMPAENAQLITDGLDVNTGVLDVLGRQFKSGESLYIKLMNFNTDVIKQCLNANMEAAVTARSAASKDDMLDNDGIGGRFILTNQYGELVTEEDLKQHYSVIYFGYTSCPDVCPTALTVLTAALKQLGDRGKNIQPYFITVDPERDTVLVMRDYVKYFDPRLIGLTGTPEMIKRVADQFKVRFSKDRVDPENPQQYTMDHPASLFLMAPDGRFITKLAYGISAQTLAQKLIEYTR
jgi:protein SCO1/2